MGQGNVALSLFTRVVVSSIFLVPILFLSLVFLPIQFSSAQEDESAVEICRPSSTIIIATDGGVVDISSLEESEVGRVRGAKGSTDSIVAELKEACGFSSFVLVDGNSAQASGASSAIGSRASDKYTDPVADAMLDACNYSVAIVHVQKDEVCVDVPACGEEKGFVWSDDHGYLWSGGYGYLWSGVYISPETKASHWLEEEIRGVPWVDNNGFVWSDNRANPWFDARSNPWFDLKASPWISLNDVCIDDLGYLWSGNYGYLWSGAYGYLWSGGYGYLWSGDYTPPSSETKASPWLEKNGVPWVD